MAIGRLMTPDWSMRSARLHTVSFQLRRVDTEVEDRGGRFVDARDDALRRAVHDGRAADRDRGRLERARSQSVVHLTPQSPRVGCGPCWPPQGIGDCDT
jgi:hypothetical protein